MRILLSNDDGVMAHGIQVLRAGLLRAGHEVTLVAPDREQSASGHAITLHRPLRIRKVEAGVYSVNGTPTDCVFAGMHRLVDGRPDVVVSGINLGPNLGEDVTYSGTVAAAFEGHILGLPAIAASMKDATGGDYESAAEVVAGLVARVKEWSPAEPRILNVNFPPGPGADWGDPRWTRLGTRHYSEELVEKTDPRGQKYYWIGGSEAVWKGEEDTDFAVIHAGGVSVTPLHLDLTDRDALQGLRDVSLAGGKG